MGWYGPQTGTCSCCNSPACGCSSTAPNQFSVTFQDWADDGCCEGCNEFCGTHVLTYTSDCWWVKESSTGTPCECDDHLGDGPLYSSNYSIRMKLEVVAGNLRVTISVYYAWLFNNWQAYIHFQKTFSGLQNCSEFTNEGIPHYSDWDFGHACNYGITEEDVLLTAL